jgi:hypothetical protein
MSLTAQDALHGKLRFRSLGSTASRYCLILALVVVAVAAPVRAGENPPTGPTTFVALRISLPNAVPMVLVAAEGRLVTYRDKVSGEWIGVVVTKRDRESDDLELDVCHVMSDENNKPQRGAQIDSLIARSGFDYFVGLATGVLEISILGHGDNPQALVGFPVETCVPGVESLEPRNEDPSPCCLSCGSTTACGCCVSGPCGSCCGC